MTTVETVRGPVPVSELGQVLMHEHLFIVGSELHTNFPGYPEPWDEDHRVSDAVTKLGAAAARGVRTIVDPTVIGLGRYLPRVQQVAERVDLNIVAATGVYTYHDEPIQFHFIGPGRPFDMPEPMTELFIADIREGIADTGVKAGVLKCAIDEAGLAPGVERVMRAVAAAHVETGTPIIVHTHAPSETGLTVLKVLTAEGVDLSKVVVAHSGDSTDVDYLRTIADTGAILGMDRFGVDLFCPFEARVSTVAEMVQRGYADRMVLSHDAACFSDLYPEQARAQALPNWHLTHIHDDVLPALREQGVSDADLTTMLVGNPARYFTPAS